MQPELQRVEIKASAAFAGVGSLCDPTGQCWLGGPRSRTAPAPRRDDHDLAVDDAAIGERSKKGVVQLGKVAVERAQVAALDVHLVLLATIDEGPEAVPLGLVQEPAAGREHLGQPGEHGLDGRVDGEGHGGGVTQQL